MRLGQGPPGTFQQDTKDMCFEMDRVGMTPGDKGYGPCLQGNCTPFRKDGRANRDSKLAYHHCCRFPRRMPRFYRRYSCTLAGMNYKNLPLPANSSHRGTLRKRPFASLPRWNRNPGHTVCSRQRSCGGRLFLHRHLVLCLDCIADKRRVAMRPWLGRHCICQLDKWCMQLKQTSHYIFQLRIPNRRRTQHRLLRWLGTSQQRSWSTS
mmetsp:Transcript_6937/g.12485  ORF Transcript_6937/g.12485 Transcript_6937/m.12485 type:complete len:208 (-) Transcript_6937:1032-1655(-)